MGDVRIVITVTLLTLANIAFALFRVLVALTIAECTEFAVAVGVQIITSTMTLPDVTVTVTADGSTPARPAIALFICSRTSRLKEETSPASSRTNATTLIHGCQGDGGGSEGEGEGGGEGEGEGEGASPLPEPKSPLPEPNSPSPRSSSGDTGAYIGPIRAIARSVNRSAFIVARISEHVEELRPIQRRDTVSTAKTRCQESINQKFRCEMDFGRRSEIARTHATPLQCAAPKSL